MSARQQSAQALAADSNAVIEIVPSLEVLEALRGEWSMLWRRCPDAMPFQAPAWLLPWARHFAPDRLRAVASREAGKLVALAAVFDWRGTLLLAGTGPSDYGDCLFAPGCEVHAAPVLAKLGVLADELNCSRVDLQQLRRSSPLLTAPLPSGWTAEVREGESCPVAQLEGEDGLGAVSKRWRGNFAYARRRLAAMQGIVMNVVEPELVKQAAGELEHLHAARWRQRGEPGVFLRDPLMGRFIRDALPQLAADGLLRLYRLELQGRAAAVVLALKARAATCFYLSGFDPQWSRLGPGTVTVGCSMMEAAAEGAREFHFLRGREAYKYRWGAEDRPTCRRVLEKRAASCA